MATSWKGIWSSITAYVVQDVATYNNNLFQCIGANTGQTPIFGTDTVYWANINTSARFPTNLDSFITYQNISASDVSNVTSYQSLITTASLTPTQQDTLNTLEQSLRNKMILPTDLNSITQAIQNLEAFFLNDVNGFVNQKTSAFNTTLNNFSYQGSWSSTTQYQTWNIVTYNSNVYFAKQSSLNVPPTTGDSADTYWCLLSKQGVPGNPGSNTTYAGIWSSTSTYIVNQLVTYNSSAYVCIQNTTVGIDPSNSSYWNVFMTNSPIPVSNTAPSAPVTNEVWVDSSNNQVKYWNNSQWIVVGTAKNATSTVPGLVEIVETPLASIPMVLTRCASFQETQISSTPTTTVLTYTPQAQHNFELNLSMRVITASTTVTIQVTYTDAGGSETYTVANQSFLVGNYAFVPFVFNATTGGAISVLVTSGTANQVYISGSLKAV